MFATLKELAVSVPQVTPSFPVPEARVSPVTLPVDAVHEFTEPNVGSVNVNLLEFLLYESPGVSPVTTSALSLKVKRDFSEHTIPTMLSATLFSALAYCEVAQAVVSTLLSTVKTVLPRIPLGITMENTPELKETDAGEPDELDEILTRSLEYEKFGRLEIVGAEQVIPKFVVVTFCVSSVAN